MLPASQCSGSSLSQAAQASLDPFRTLARGPVRRPRVLWSLGWCLCVFLCVCACVSLCLCLATCVYAYMCACEGVSMFVFVGGHVCV